MSACEQLRSGSRDAHRMLDEGLCLTQITGTVQGYTNYLTLLAQSHAQVEPTMWQALDDPDDHPWVTLRRSAMSSLLNDLAQLCVSPGVLAHLTRRLGAQGFSTRDGGVAHPDLRDPKSRWRALGALYVVHGSSRGAAVIAQKVRACLGSGLGQGYVGLTGWSDPELGWRAFMTHLDHSLRTREAMGEALAGALGVFEVFAKNLIPPQRGHRP